MDATYASWAAMHRRCYNPNDKDFSRYGGQGITVYGPWHDFATFKQDMGEKPEGLTLERKNNEASYGPFNCKWATRLEQANNRCNTRGAAVKARQQGMTRQAMLYRMDHGIAATEPKRPSEAQHGTISRYSSAKHKCRCGLCTEAWRLYHSRKK